MKAREKTLLMIFLTLLVSLAGGGLLVVSLKSYRSIAGENQALTIRLAAMKDAIAQGEQWQARSQWLEIHAPPTPPRNRPLPSCWISCSSMRRRRA